MIDAFMVCGPEFSFYEYEDVSFLSLEKSLEGDSLIR